MKSTPLALLLITLFAVSCVSAARQGRRLLDDGSKTSSKSGDTSKNKGSVKGDPILTSFDGQQFEFHGKGDHFYNLVSEPGVFQVLILSSLFQTDCLRKVRWLPLSLLILFWSA